MGMDMVPSAAPVSQEVVAREQVSRKGGGDVFAALLQQITSARLSPQEGPRQGEKAVPSEQGIENEADLEEPAGQVLSGEIAIPFQLPLDNLFPPEGSVDEQPGELTGSQGSFPVEGMGAIGVILEMFPNLEEELGSLPPEELFALEQKLISGEIPLLDGKGFLTPEAGNVIFTYLGKAEVQENLQSLASPAFTGQMEMVEKFQPPYQGDGKTISEDFLPVAGSLEGDPPVETQPGLEKQQNPANLPRMGENGLPVADAPDAVPEGQIPSGKEDHSGEQTPAGAASGNRIRVEGFSGSLPSGGKAPPAGEAPPMDVWEKGPLPEFPLNGEEALGNSQGQGGGDFISSSLNRSDETPAGWRALPHLNFAQPGELAAQVAEKMTLFTRPGEQELRMRLQPEFLGEILIKMKRIKGVLTAEIVTQNIAVKELLEGQMDALRQRFQQMEMHVEEFHVFLDSDKNGGGDRGTNENSAGGKPGAFVPKGAYGREKDGDLNRYGENGRVNYLA
jgi:hypothetical protein